MTMYPQSDSGHFVTRISLSSEANCKIQYRGIESLPPEIISHIFIIGSDKLKHEDFGDFGDRINNNDVDNNDDDEVEGQMHFATLCSYVCQRWRNIALDTCQLWSYLAFDGSLGSLERSRVWISRSKDVPLAIHVDLTSDDQSDSEETIIRTSAGYLNVSHMILDLILPYVLRWQLFVLRTDSYDLIWQWQTRLALLQSAPVLEHIGIFCHTDWIVEDVFDPPKYLSDRKSTR